MGSYQLVFPDITCLKSCKILGLRSPRLGGGVVKKIGQSTCGKWIMTTFSSFENESKWREGEKQGESAVKVRWKKGRGRMGGKFKGRAEP